MSGVRIVAMIPARMASSRFPGKPLLTIAGLPMIEHVRRRTVLCRGFAEVIVVTCDSEIADAVRQFGGTCFMTSPTHPGATDRVSEAMQQVDCTHVVNVQGDEILVLPSDLERMAHAIEAEPSVPAWNAVAPLEHAAELDDPSVVKSIVSESGRILFCTRRCPHLAAFLGGGVGPVRRMLGILGYRRDFLERYGRLPRTPLERAEQIDQMRIIEHDVLLRSIPFSRGYPGINEPREIPLVESLLREDTAQQTVLQEIARP